MGMESANFISNDAAVLLTSIYISKLPSRLARFREIKKTKQALFKSFIETHEDISNFKYERSAHVSAVS